MKPKKQERLKRERNALPYRNWPPGTPMVVILVWLEELRGKP